ncbi:MAG: extracellular solute-binding protein [Phycisphaeraceae bacterium]|nr:extracellular solute-binding protein [Phycisphaeraceae bacterium]
MSKSMSGGTKWASLFVLALTLGWVVQPARAGWVEDTPHGTIIHVTSWQLPDPAQTDPANMATLKAMHHFIKTFPDLFARKYKARYEAQPEKYGRHNWNHVEIRLEQYSGITVENVETDLLAIAGDMAPDILYVNFRKSENYISNGFLYPLDLPEDGYVSAMTKEELDQRVYPTIWPVIHRKGPDGRKHVWSMPYDGALGKVLLYRKDLFDAKGIAYPDKNWTWEDLFEACRKITEPDKGIYGIMGGRGSTESWFWCTYLWSMGGDVMLYDEAADKWRLTFDSRAAAVALEYYTRLSAEKWTDANGKIVRGYSSKDVSTNSWVKWERGEVGILISYIDERIFAAINPDVTGMAPIPLGYPDENGVRHRGGELNSRMMGLYAKIKHPAIRDAAWEYIINYDSDASLAIKTKAMVEGGLGRFLSPRHLRRYGYSEIERLSPKGWADTFDIAIETGKPEPYGRNSNFAYEQMTLPIEKADQLARKDQLPEDYEARVEVMRQLLREQVAKANEKMLGIVTPRQLALRRVAAVTLLVVIVGVFFTVFRKIVHAFTPEHVRGQGRGSWQFRRYALAYFLLIPALVTILLWHYLPLMRGSVMAFMDYQILRQSTWIWLDNFGEVMWEGEWWSAIYNSLRYSFLVIFLTFLPPIILAILLQEVPRATLLYRTIYYLPAVVTGLVTIVLWKQFYDPSQTGVLNRILLHTPAIVYLLGGLAFGGVAANFGFRLIYHEARWQGLTAIAAGFLLFFAFAWLASPIIFVSNSEGWLPTLRDSNILKLLFVDRLPEPYAWLSDRETAMIACVIPMVWAGMGPGCLIYLAALKGISDDFYEAADIDGATFTDKILFVVFPILKPLIIINFVGVFIGSWQGSSANVLAMTGGGADTVVADLYIWYKAFTYLKMGPATAAAWMLAVMLIGFTVYQLRILSRLEFRTTGEKKK